MTKENKSLKIYDVIRQPVVSEKSTIASANNTYLFKVCDTANKQDIKEAVESIFKVSVTSVNTLNQLGKVKRFKGRLGKRNGYKKAMVRLKDGDVIEFGAKV